MQQSDNSLSCPAVNHRQQSLPNVCSRHADADTLTVTCLQICTNDIRHCEGTLIRAFVREPELPWASETIRQPANMRNNHWASHLHIAHLLKRTHWHCNSTVTCPQDDD
jgi:hypothetical protein